MSEEQNNRRWYRSPAGIIGTIFIGAIGSGLWEIFLRDALLRFYFLVGSAIGSFSTKFLDDLHEDIGKANQNEIGVFLFILFVVVIIALNILGSKFIFHAYKRTSDNNLTPTKYRSVSYFRKARWGILAMAVFNIAAYSHQSFSTLYRLKAIMWVERSIEIVHPSISEAEFLKLRAQYRGVSSAKDFYSLENQLKKYGQRSKAALPEFTSIGNPNR